MYLEISLGGRPQDVGDSIFAIPVPKAVHSLFDNLAACLLRLWSLKYEPLNKAQRSRTKFRKTKCMMSNGTEAGKDIVRRSVNRDTPLIPNVWRRFGSAKLALPSWM